MNKLLSLFLILGLFTFLIVPSVSSLTWNGPTIVENTLNVNNSIFWDSHPFSFLASNYIPYSGAVFDLNLGVYKIISNKFSENGVGGTISSKGIHTTSGYNSSGQHQGPLTLSYINITGDEKLIYFTGTATGNALVPSDSLLSTDLGWHGVNIDNYKFRDLWLSRSANLNNKIILNGTSGTINATNITAGTLSGNNSYWDSAYSHSIDNSQAHSDYLINNNNDTTSGVLTARGFIAYLQPETTYGIKIDASSEPRAISADNYGLIIDKITVIDYYNTYIGQIYTFGSLSKLIVNGEMSGTISGFANEIRNIASTNQIVNQGLHDIDQVQYQASEYNIGLENKVKRNGTIKTETGFEMFNYAMYNELTDEVRYNRTGNSTIITDSLFKAKYISSNSAIAGTMNRNAYLLDVDIANPQMGSFNEMSGIRVTSSGNPFNLFNGSIYKGIDLSASQGISATVGYGIYLNALSGTTKWGFYNNVASAKNLLGLDNTESYFGNDRDASIYYNGVDMILNPKLVGTGKFKVLGNIDSTGNINAKTNFSVNNIQGLTFNYTTVCDVDLVGLTKKYQNFTVIGGIIVGNSSCA